MQKDSREAGLWVFLIDLISLIISYVLGAFTWTTIYRLFINEKRQMHNFGYGLTVFLIAFVLVSLFIRDEKDFLRRVKMDEMFHSIKLNLSVVATAILMIYLFNESDNISRGVAGITVILNIFIDFFIRMLFKKSYIKRLGTKKVSQMLLITTLDRAERIIKKFQSNREWGRRISGICILDAQMEGEKICGIKVVADYMNVLEYAKAVIVDEIYINVAYTTGKHVMEFARKFEEMGITVYLNIDLTGVDESAIGRIEMLQGTPVIASAIRTFSWNRLAVKRIMDILGAIVGLLITIIITPFIAIPLLIESPGPLFFKQKRVGRNGRYFYIYKFRSMYKDAEARKAELMEKNEMKGAMFKMKDDPRITKVGKFIRKTSIDELPQFFNILKGDMSLVGTRPPTVDEFREYTPYQKRRLSLKPGLTGMWQVSGRSDIEDFEEVVKLDLEYIDNWKISLDIKIILKTILVVFKHEGSR